MSWLESIEEVRREWTRYRAGDSAPNLLHWFSIAEFARHMHWWTLEAN